MPEKRKPEVVSSNQDFDPMTAAPSVVVPRKQGAESGTGDRESEPSLKQNSEEASRLLEPLKTGDRIAFSRKLKEILKKHSDTEPLILYVDADDPALLETMSDALGLLRFLKAKSDGSGQALRVKVTSSRDLARLYPNELSSGVAFEPKK